MPRERKCEKTRLSKKPSFPSRRRRAFDHLFAKGIEGGAEQEHRGSEKKTNGRKRKKKKGLRSMGDMRTETIALKDLEEKSARRSSRR